MKNKIKLIIILLLIAMISMISFIGIYQKDKSSYKSVIKEYQLSDDLTGKRLVEFQPITEYEDTTETEETTETTETVFENTDENLTYENFSSSKDIIEARLKELAISQYSLRINKDTGKIIITLPEDDFTSDIIANIISMGRFELKDSETKEVFLKNENVDKATVGYNSTDGTNTTVYLNIVFNKESKKTLEDLSNAYIIKTTDTTTETQTDTTTEVQKKIIMSIDDNEILNSGFGEPITTGSLQLSMGTSADSTELSEYLKTAGMMAMIINSDTMQVEYETVQNRHVISTIDTNTYNVLIISASIFVLIIICIFTFRYKLKGLFSAFSILFLVAIQLLVIRYANVIISIEGIFGIVITAIIYIGFLIELLENKSINKDEIIKDFRTVFVKYVLKLIPICLIMIVLSFAKFTPIFSLGLTIFWGIFSFIITSILIQRNILLYLDEEGDKNEKSKK